MWLQSVQFEHASCVEANSGAKIDTIWHMFESINFNFSEKSIRRVCDTHSVHASRSKYKKNISLAVDSAHIIISVNDSISPVFLLFALVILSVTETCSDIKYWVRNRASLVHAPKVKVISFFWKKWQRQEKKPRSILPLAAGTMINRFGYASVVFSSFSPSLYLSLSRWLSAYWICYTWFRVWIICLVFVCFFARFFLCTWTKSAAQSTFENSFYLAFFTGREAREREHAEKRLSLISRCI